MCLIVLAYKAHPRYPLVVAANRDEFYERPTEPAHFWTDAPHVLAGRDLRAGGTWLGITSKGRFAAVTNYRDPGNHRSDARSRGELVSGFLTSGHRPREFLEEVAARADEYNGFSLFVADSSELCFFSNKARVSDPAEGVTSLDAGVYGLSNHLLDTPWPKVERSKAALERRLEHDTLSADDLLELLLDRTLAREDQLPRTGVGPARERVLSPIFVRTERYGTRSSTALLVDRDQRAVFKEKNFAANGEETATVVREFRLG